MYVGIRPPEKYMVNTTKKFSGRRRKKWRFESGYAPRQVNTTLAKVPRIV